MVNKFDSSRTKTINSLLFVLDLLGGRCDFHKIFKILYFADQKHLTLYGMPITGDTYIAMKDGPVPSESYDIFKMIRDGSSFIRLSEDYSDSFEIEGKFVAVAKKKPDTEELSETEIECLNESIEENKALNFGDLSSKSHSTAWGNAINNEMDVIDIANEAGANEEMIRYIYLNLENQKTFKKYAVVR